MTGIVTEDVAYVLFTLGDGTYALPTAAIQQLDMVGTVTPVPTTRPYVAGLVSVRGQVLPAMDLRARLGFPSTAATLRSRLLVVRAGARTVGFIVDSAREFAPIPAEAIQPPPDTMGEATQRCLRGVARLGDRLVLVLDAEQLLAEGGDAAPAFPAPRA